MPARSVVCIGVATHDVIASALDPVLPDGRIIASELVEAGGGNAATAAVTLTRLGWPAHFIGRTGDDELGATIRTGLEREGVGVTGLRRVAGARSAASVIIVNPATAQRSIVTFLGAAVSLVLDDAELACCRDAAWIHVDQVGVKVVGQLRAAGIDTPVSLDAGNPIPDLDLSAITLYAPTQKQLYRTVGTEDLEAALRLALAAGPRIVAATAGEAGSVAAIREQGEVRIYRAPAMKPPSMGSTLGAGDVFHGALLAGLLTELPLPGALRFANGAAALACRGLDGQSAIPTRAELETFLAAGPA